MLHYVQWLILSLLLSIGAGCADAAVDASADRSSASAAAVDHHLKVILDPARQRLSATDRLTIPAGPSSVAFRMAAHLSIDALFVNGQAAAYTQAHDRVTVALDASGEAVDITIAYSGTFDDQAPVEPLNTDNPGYGVTGTIGDQGTMLLAGAGWYPDAEGLEDRYALVVDAPEGTVAVTSGTPGTVVSEGDRTLSHWSTGITHRGLPLVAGPYTISQRRFGNVTAATYFSAELQHLSNAYLASTGRYLKLYASLFGPYPHDQFAVVENFFPTGYGFSSFTLMGRRVLALPFIRHTSLGHEIAHCWWGNGVLVDASQGNWSEALTTYVADYLFKERSGDGRAHRRQWLRNYASLVAPSRDIPLSRFMQRTDPVTRVVGYEKGAMVFHMLRKSLGDDIFWAALRDVAHRKRFKAVAWSDLQSAFEAHSGRSLGPYFDQWLFRPRRSRHYPGRCDHCFFGGWGPGQRRHPAGGARLYLRPGH
jgi:hypothetical protein